MATDTTAVTPEQLRADGWETVQIGGFNDLAGPFWIRGEGTERMLGLLIEEKHCNTNLGTIHGGATATFADLGLGMGLAVLGDDAGSCVTTSLSVNYISVAKIGEFIRCDYEVVRATRDMVFVRGLIKSGERTVASVDGIWKLLRPSVKAKLAQPGSQSSPLE